ncbi:MAG: hypothetical protein HY840_14030 [Bacteroidetes bacterium]|nr:hypothetical protein [Bacteroidota bacterium]
MMEITLEQQWQLVCKKISVQFDQELDLQGILFLIGVQELGKGYKNFSKDEKVELMHVAICKLLESFSYYEFAGRDEQGWPHWNLNEKLPPLKPMQQEILVKEAIIEYFSKENKFEI